MPNKDISWVIDFHQENDDAYQEYDNYYGGEHPLLFATEKFRNTFGNLFRAFADNLCPAVVSAVVDRMVVAGWDGKNAKQADDLWTAAKLQRISGDVFLETRKVGDSYLLVWPDKNGKVRFWQHDARQCCVEYDEDEEPGAITKGARIWTDGDEFGRLNLYYPDHIEKWITTRKVTSGMPSKPAEWSKFAPDVLNPYDTVPMFHFAHDAVLGDTGTSILSNVIPVQNALNKSVCDMLVAGEFVAYPQRFATGLQVEVDEDTGKPKNPPFTPGVDRVWTAAGDVKFGEFSAADLQGFIHEQDSFKHEIARVSGTPAHFLNLDVNWPTGESLRVAEGRLINTVKRECRNDGMVLVGAVKLGIRMDGNADLNDDDIDLEVVWENAAPHNPLLDAETQLVKQQVGTSKKQSLKELGYKDDQIKEMMADNDAEAQKQADMAMKSVAPPGGPNAFNRNGSPGQASKPAPLQQQQAKVPVPMPRAGRGQYQEG